MTSRHVLLTRLKRPPTQRRLEHDPKMPPAARLKGLASGVFRTDMFVLTSERVAQAVEHVTFNHGVEGSSPSALTMHMETGKAGLS